MNNKCDILVVIPFFNEEQRLPEILDSIAKSASNKFKVHLVMVNHQSIDDSIKIVKEFSSQFFKLDIIEENFPIHCGGQPRSTGIKKAIELAENYYLDDSIPIVTLDADVIVSINFVSEIIDKLNNDFEIVSFCERYNSTEFLKFINKQKNIDLAIKSFVGLNWLRYQILWGLINSGIKETRGPCGYAMRAKTLKQLGHKQPFDSDGQPVTGENNRLEIIANRNNLKVYSSPYYSQVHPRREIISCNNISQKGYSKNNCNAEVFKLVRELDNYPVLTDEQIQNYLSAGIKRAIRMVLIRAIAYDRLNVVKIWFNHPMWYQIIELSTQYVNQNKPSEEILEVIGNGFYNDMFNFVMTKIDGAKFESFIKYLENKIPDNNDLNLWINDQSLIIKPDPTFIKL